MKKTHLLVKTSHLEEARAVFEKDRINITDEGRKYLGAPIDSNEYCEKFCNERVAEWVDEIETMAQIAKSQPQAVLSLLTKEVTSKWSFLLRTTKGISHLLQPLEQVIRLKLLPNITGREYLSDMERRLFGLPPNSGGLGIPDNTTSADQLYKDSLRITAALTDLIKSDRSCYDEHTKTAQQQAKREVLAEHKKTLKEEAAALRQDLPDNLRKAMIYGSEKGASSWLTTLPLREFGFNLTKGAFHDALHLRYGWPLKYLPANCVCGSNNSIEHALSCPCGGYVIHRHDDIRDTTAALMAEVCRDVTIEPRLQPVTGEEFTHRSSNLDDDARLDVKAQGFWGDRSQDAFFDVRVFNPLASSNNHSPLKSNYEKHEREKRRTYEQRVIQIEHGVFTPLVFSACGGMGPAAKVAYSLLAAKLAEKRGAPYQKIVSWIRCVLSFSLLRSAIRCIRGSRQSYRKPKIDYASIDLQI